MYHCIYNDTLAHMNDEDNYIENYDKDATPLFIKKYNDLNYKSATVLPMHSFYVNHSPGKKRAGRLNTVREFMLMNTPTYTMNDVHEYREMYEETWCKTGYLGNIEDNKFMYKPIVWKEKEANDHQRSP